MFAIITQWDFRQTMPPNEKKNKKKRICLVNSLRSLLSLALLLLQLCRLIGNSFRRSSWARSRPNANQSVSHAVEERERENLELKTEN